MAKAPCCGTMEQGTRVSGNWAEHGVKALSLIQRERSTKESGGMTKRTDLEGTYILMELNMRESGVRTCSMGLERRDGLMAQSLKDPTEKERKMVWVNTFGPMAHAMKVNGRIMK